LAKDKGALCLACADLDHLVFLPSGDTALTRRARKHSTLTAVVLKWSRARKRYERQGLLVEAGALEMAEEECSADMLDVIRPTPWTDVSPMNVCLLEDCLRPQYNHYSLAELLAAELLTAGVRPWASRVLHQPSPERDDRISPLLLADEQVTSPGSIHPRKVTSVSRARID